MAPNLKDIMGRQDGFGETYYLVDSDFRTNVQGWTQPDGTGPLDLFNERSTNRVFMTPGGTTTPAGATDAAAMQVAIDQMVDFRGDTLFFLPGTYTPAAALVIDVPHARWMGQPRERAHTASLVAGIDAAFTCTAAADSMDVSYLRMVPLTAGVMWSLPAGVDNFDTHHFTYDARGITASTSTIFLKHTGACLCTSVRNFVGRTNTALGPLVQTAATSLQGEINGFAWFHTANTLVTLLYETISGGAGASGWMVGNGHVQIGAGGVVTNLGAQIDMTAAGTNATLVNITTSVAGATAALGWEAATGLAGEGDIVRCTVALIAGGNATVGAGGGSAIFGTT